MRGLLASSTKPFLACTSNATPKSGKDSSPSSRQHVSHMLVGYARVSTDEQTLDLQQDALQKLGCDHIFTDTASGAKTDRPGLEEALGYVRAGDTLVVWRLDR